MKARPLGSRLAVYGFAFALLLKAAVPLVATWSAALQGKSVAEICTVYGVALPNARAHAHAMHGDVAGHESMSDAMHAMHAMGAMQAAGAMHAVAAMDGGAAAAMHAGTATQVEAMHARAVPASTSSGPADAPQPHDAGSHAGDHCVLTALVAFAFAAALAPVLPSAGERDAFAAVARGSDPIGVDASARWAARLRHGPPISS